jgi:hypothetical protein
VKLTCSGCGVTFERERRKARANAQQSRTGEVYCTPACAGRSFYKKG